ncbi:MAG: PQQ-dependent sugar dehydrogenase [Deferrisomatales bacterium]|nr:PQQ-dependent sugar dehydrogenase [Deferrisomatales bacterium]
MGALRAERLVGNAFDRPVAAVPFPSRPGRWLVAEQGGFIHLVDAAAPPGATAPFADLTAQADASSVESGLLGLAFDPNFTANRRVFLSYTGAGLASRLSLFRTAPGGETLELASERVLLELRQPGDVHNGGKILFGPDGYLYMGFGDGAQGLDPGRHGQNPDTLFGTILRLDVSADDGYRIPRDNPFAAGGGRPEVYAYGFRNPWGIGFDTQTGDLWVADVGENDREEIDLVRPGGNYGWSLREGTRCVRQVTCEAPGLIDPIYEYGHGEECSVTGGTVYRGKAIPWLRGAYVFADWCSGTVWGLFRDTSGAVQSVVLAATGLSITAISADATGELHLLDYMGGGFYRLAP